MKRRWLLIPVAVVVGLLAYAGFLWFALRGGPEDLSRLASELGVRPGMTVAEIGAGKGRWTVEMARLVGPSGRVYSTELNPERLDQIREAVREAGLSNVEIVAGSTGSTSLPADCCDAIFMRTVYHHFTQPHAMNRDLHRALREGGAIGIVDFEPTGLWQWAFRLRRRIPEGVPSDRGGHGIPIGLVEEELQAAGFVPDRRVPGWSRGLFLVTARKPHENAAQDHPAGTGQRPHTPASIAPASAAETR